MKQARRRSESKASFMRMLCVEAIRRTFCLTYPVVRTRFAVVPDGRDPLPGEVHTQGLAQECPGQRPASTLTQDDHHTPLAAAVTQQPAITTLVSPIGRPDMSAKRGTIHFDQALETRLMRLCRHRLAKLVHQNEGRLVLHIQIARKLHC